MAMIRCRDDHKLFDQIMLIFLFHVDSFLLQVHESTIYNFNTPLDNQSPGVKFRLGLLDKQEGLCHFGMISHLHDLHLLDVDPANVASLLEEHSHVVADQRRISHKAGLIGS